jgi:hypothetical protein
MAHPTGLIRAFDLFDILRFEWPLTVKVADRRFRGNFLESTLGIRRKLTVARKAASHRGASHRGGLPQAAEDIISSGHHQAVHRSGELALCNLQTRFRLNNGI